MQFNREKIVFQQGVPEQLDIHLQMKKKKKNHEAPGWLSH